MHELSLPAAWQRQAAAGHWTSWFGPLYRAAYSRRYEDLDGFKAELFIHVDARLTRFSIQNVTGPTAPMRKILLKEGFEENCQATDVTCTYETSRRVDGVMGSRGG